MGDLHETLKRLNAELDDARAMIADKRAIIEKASPAEVATMQDAIQTLIDFKHDLKERIQGLTAAIEQAAEQNGVRPTA